MRDSKLMRMRMKMKRARFRYSKTTKNQLTSQLVKQSHKQTSQTKSFPLLFIPQHISANKLCLGIFSIKCGHRIYMIAHKQLISFLINSWKIQIGRMMSQLIRMQSNQSQASCKRVKPLKQTIIRMMIYRLQKIHNNSKMSSQMKIERVINKLILSVINLMKAIKLNRIITQRIKRARMFKIIKQAMQQHLVEDKVPSTRLYNLCSWTNKYRHRLLTSKQVDMTCKWSLQIKLNSK